MFDRYSKTEHVGPSLVKIHEHRAPTDDSMRLLREMEEKALASVVGTLQPAEGNTFTGVVICRHTADAITKNVWVHFTLNGQKYEVGPIKLNDPLWGDKQAWIKILRDELAKEIANKLVFDNITELVPR